MRRLCFALDLKDDPELIARYKEWHRPGSPPAAVTRSLRDSGIETLEIHLSANRLFMIMEVGEKFSLEAKAAADAANAEVQQWETLMWTFQQALPWAKPGQKWVAMEKIFDLTEQPTPA